MRKNKSQMGVGIFYAILLLGISAYMFITGDNYSLFAYNETLIYAFCALSVSVMLGMTGMMSFAAVAFYGLGAYVVANLTTGRIGIEMNTTLALLIAPLVTALIAALLGMPLLRLRGNYFTFSTIALVQVCWCFYNNTPAIFGGYDGIRGIPDLNLFGWVVKSNKAWMGILIVLLALVMLFIQRMRNSRIGRSMAAIRDNETAALTLGINVYRTRVLTFAIAAGIAGFGGAVYACFTGFISADCFTYNAGIPFIVMAMLGGINSSFGCVLGAVLVGMLPEWLRVLESYMQLIYGIGVILLMIFMPMGLAGILQNVQRKIKKRKMKSQTKGGIDEDGFNPAP